MSSAVSPTASSAVSSITPSALPPADRRFQRQAITEHFLTALEDVVWRYRTLATHPEHADLHAEVVTAEVAHQLEVTRQALRRVPPPR